MSAKDMYGQPSRFAGARAVDRGGRLLWVGPMLPNQQSEFFLDEISLGGCGLSVALGCLAKATRAQP